MHEDTPSAGAATKPTHLLIINDVQAKSVARLRPDRRDVYVPKIENFARAVRPHMPVIWIAVDSGFRVYADSVTQPMDRAKKAELVERLGLPQAAAEAHDTIVTKNVRNGFADPNVLEPYIRRTHPDVKTIGHAGMSTLYCITENIVGATNAGFGSIVHHDLLADENIHIRAEKKPSAHKHWLQNDYRLFDMLHGREKKVAFVASDDFIKQHIPATEPAPKRSIWNAIIEGYAACARCDYRL